MKPNLSNLLVIAPALVFSLSAEAQKSSGFGAFEYGIKATTGISKGNSKLKDLEFVGGILLTEGIKAVIRMELKDQDLSDIEIEQTLEEMKLSIAIDKVTGNPRALVTNIDIGLVKSVFGFSGSENSNKKSNFLYGLSDSDKGVVGLTIEINPELLSLVNSARISVYETSEFDGFDIADEKAISGEVTKQIGKFAVQFSTRWKEMASEAEAVPNYATAVTVGVNVQVLEGVTVGPYIRKVLGEFIEDETVVGVNVSVALYKKATRTFIEERK